MSEILDNIKNLRELTGAGFLDCKKALEENNNNIDDSIDFLRKKGLSKASKKSSREANEGAIGIYSNDDKTVIIEINTETDFAAKNNVFLEFFDKMGIFALNIKSNSKEDFLNYEHDDKKMSEYFSEIIAKIGENIVLRRINFLDVDKNCKIFSYVHNSYKKNIGKICVILKAEILEENDEIVKLGKNLCMHIAATKPIALNKEKLDPQLILKEKEIQLSSIKSSGKPENIIEKILEGKMNKFYSEVTLLNQIFILDNEKNIDQVLKEFSNKNKFNIIDYKYFVLGS